MKKTTQIYSDNGFLNFSMGQLASSEEFGSDSRDIGSVYEALEPGELVEFEDGQFILNSDLDLAFKFVGYCEEGHEQWLKLASGEVKSSWGLV